MNTSRSKLSQAGFSLVEVVLVIGVLAVSFLPLVALMPSGQKNFRSAMNLTICSQIAQRVVNDATQANFDTLIDGPGLRELDPRDGFTFRAPSIKHPGVRYFDDQGTEIVPVNDDGTLTPGEDLRAVYQVITRIMPSAPLMSSRSGSISESKQMPSLAQVTVQVIAAPPSVPLPLSEAGADDINSPHRNLVEPRDHLEIYTFSAFIGRAL